MRKHTLEKWKYISDRAEHWANQRQFRPKKLPLNEWLRHFATAIERSENWTTCAKRVKCHPDELRIELQNVCEWVDNLTPTNPEEVVVKIKVLELIEQFDDCMAQNLQGEADADELLALLK